MRAWQSELSFDVADLADTLGGIFATLEGEGDTLSALAQRTGIDLPYYYFVRPLCALGLIWDAKVLSVQHVTKR